MANKQPFDETLYRLVEQDDAAASAAQLKARIDGEPEFAAAFDRTRKTVLALQGMGPKPADRPVGTFGQRDFERLTRGILKSYRMKLSDLYLALGKSYLHQESEKGLAILGRETDPTEEQVRPRVQKAQESFRSVGGEWDALPLEDRTFEHSRPVKKSLVCFKAGRSLSPRSSALSNWEGLSHLRVGDLVRAQDAFALAGDLAGNPSEMIASLDGLAVVEFFRDDYRKQAALLQQALAVDPLSVMSLNNLGVALLNLGELRQGVILFENLYARAGFDAGLRRDCTRAVSVAENWAFFRKEPALFDRYLRAARVHLGEEASNAIERVGL